MLVYTGTFDQDLSKYGFKKVLDPDVAYIKRTNKGNAFIGLDKICLSFHEEMFDELIKNGLVMKEAE